MNDLIALNWFTIQRKQTERPLVFYRLRYHITKHLVKSNAIIEGVARQNDNLQLFQFVSNVALYMMGCIKA